MTKRKGTTDMTDEETQCADLASPKYAGPVVGDVVGGAVLGVGATLVVQKYRGFRDTQ